MNVYYSFQTGRPEGSAAPALRRPPLAAAGKTAYTNGMISEFSIWKYYSRRAPWA